MEEHTNMPNVNERGEQPKRRAVTAESMAAKQRDISVSEFFAKNRHLLGFDNPRKALLTAVKEAVDNSLDACEEAGIVPEVWVHIEATGPNRYKIGVQDNGPGIVKKQIPLIFGKLLYGSKQKREVDFLVVKDRKPWFLVEVKMSDNALSPWLGYFQAQSNARHAFQAVMNLPYEPADCFHVQRPVIVPAKTLLSQLL